MKKRRIAGSAALLLSALFLFFACGAPCPNPSGAPGEPLRPSPVPYLATVVVDAGHGGVDGGAIGVKTGVVEAGLNLAIARLVKQKLERHNIEARMTRIGEKALASGKKADMKARGKIISAPDVDLVVSIHMNKFRDRSASGPMVFYMKGSEEGRILAGFLIESVCEAVGHARRHANPGDYYVIRVGAAPSAIVECGFLSNAADEKLLSLPEHQEKLAEGIAAGILAYLNRPISESAPPADPTPQAEGERDP